MSKVPDEWEQQLKKKPFKDSHFSPQMQQRVEQRLGGHRRRRFMPFAYAAVLLPVIALVLWFGYSSLEPGKLHNANNDPEAVGIRSYYNSEITFPSSDEESGEVSLPLTAILSDSVLDDGNSPVFDTPPPLPAMTFPLQADLEDKLQALLVFQPNTGGAYLLLAPAGWTASAVTGANGSYGVSFTDPEDPEQFLHYSDNAWGCQGCAVGNIGTYFPGKAEWSEEYGITVIPPVFTEQQLAGTEGADARTVRYSMPAESAGYQTDGTAYYEDGEWGYLFRKLEMTTASGFSGEEIIRIIQSFFAANHGPVNLPAVQTPQTAAAGKVYTKQSLFLALEQRGMTLNLVPEANEPLFNDKLAGVRPDELLIGTTDTNVQPDRLSVYTFADSGGCAEGLAELKAELSRLSNNGELPVYPHIFTGGKFLVVYWKGGDSAEPYVYDKAIKLALHSLEDGK